MKIQDPLLAVYTNMARHNVFNIIRAAQDAFSITTPKKLKDDAGIAMDSHFLMKLLERDYAFPDQRRWKVINYLKNRNYLPILHHFYHELEAKMVKEYEGKASAEKPETNFFNSVKDYLAWCFTTLNTLRNASTHMHVYKANTNAEYDPLHLPNEYLIILNNLYESAKATAKSKFGEALGNHLFDQSNKIDFQTNDNQFSKLGLAFFICQFLDQRNATIYLQKTGVLNHFTGKLRLAHIKCFTTYCVKTPEKKITNENQEQSLLLQIMQDLERCPNNLYMQLSDDDKKKLQPQLSEDQVNRIIENSLSGNINYDIELEQLVKELSGYRRPRNRFNYFAVRFLDIKDALGKYKFQLSMGKLLLRTYTKKILSTEDERRILRELFVGGNLQNFQDEDEVLNTYTKRNPSDTEVTFEQFSPKYNIVDNTIAIYDKEFYPTNRGKTNKTKEEKAAVNQPKAYLSLRASYKMALLYVLHNDEDILENIITKHIGEFNPFEILSSQTVFDIHAELKKEEERFASPLRQVSADDTKMIFPKRNSPNQSFYKARERYVKELKYRKNILQDQFIKRNIDINVNSLPEKLLHYLLNVNSLPSSTQNDSEMAKKFEKEFHKKIRFENDQAKSICKKIEENKNDLSNIKLGKLATLVTKDIMKQMINVGEKNKFTTPYYRELQSAIAHFSTNKQKIITFCDYFSLFKNKVGHPFLTKNLITNATGVIHFTELYFQAKTNWFRNNFLKKGSKEEDYKDGGFKVNEDQITKLPYSLRTWIAKRTKNFDIIEWWNNKIGKPVNLPENIFDDELKRALIKEIPPEQLPVPEQQKIGKLLRIFIQNDEQFFYGFKRYYSYNTKATKSEEKKFIYDPKVTQNVKSATMNINWVNNHEKRIRFTRTKDRVALKLAEMLATEKGFSTNNMQLKQFVPNAQNSPLKQPIRFEKIINHDEIEDNFNGEKNFYTIPEKIIVADDKLSDKYENQERESKWNYQSYSRFNRVVYDKRLPGLLSAFEAKTIPFELLEYELNSYDNEWLKIIEKTAQFENAIYRKDSNGIIEICKTKYGKKTHDIEFEVYEQWLKNRNIILHPIVTYIRNKFSHSQLPLAHQLEFDLISIRESDSFLQKYENDIPIIEQYTTYSKRIFQLYDEKMSDLMEQISIV